MRKRDYTVYLHINKVNKKVYVGITSMRVENRWREGKGYKKCEIMNKAILKYGWSNFEHIILCKTSKGRAIILVYGRKPSENTLLAYRKVILQFSLDGEFIKEFSSIKEASGEIGIFKPAIVHCLKGKTKKAGGYKWKYKYE